MKNYICINGNKTELTEEQLKQLGIELPKANPFERVEYDKSYYLIAGDGNIVEEHDHRCRYDNGTFDSANYCTDKSLIQQRAFHETLNRLLWRYSMEHDGDKIDWNSRLCAKYYIIFDHLANAFDVNLAYTTRGFETYFGTDEIAENAIKEIVEPFMEAHPDFKF